MTHTSIFKRGFTALMAMLLCLSSFIGLGATKAYAAGEQAEIYLISFPRDGDANYNGEWGHPALNFMNGCIHRPVRCYNYPCHAFLYRNCLLLYRTRNSSKYWRYIDPVG